MFNNFESSQQNLNLKMVYDLYVQLWDVWSEKGLGFVNFVKSLL